ncbi:hypothetical protein BpHYR1_014808 [Brachionus plicatilis]|uniref:Uncharacterized protein n=1 Tax=Brachionus plicatilis TaxID=10195 RepID=A0A3M7PWW7_BRAPC|nr:hypothetical protein BpHYR1_014808 [Brachionus plicatilis]
MCLIKDKTKSNREIAKLVGVSEKCVRTTRKIMISMAPQRNQQDSYLWYSVHFAVVKFSQTKISTS